MAQMTTCKKIGQPGSVSRGLYFRFSFSSVPSFFPSVPSLLTVFLFLFSMTGEHVDAQTTAAPRTTAIPVEGRLDAIAASTSAIQAGIGLTTVAGTYVRTGIVGAIGASQNGVSGRIDGFTRFHLDPFRESRWAPYGGAGLSTRFEQGERARAYLLIFAGIDGPIRNGLTTSIEAGLGGGGRLGIILRRAVARQR